jgi:hypothetical protein
MFRGVIDSGGMHKAWPKKALLGKHPSTTLDAPTSEEFDKARNFSRLELYNLSDTGSS